MASPPPSYTSSASVSRSNTSQDELGSMADSMLRASLTRSISSASSVSSTPPPYRSMRSVDPAPFSSARPSSIRTEPPRYVRDRTRTVHRSSITRPVLKSAPTSAVSGSAGSRSSSSKLSAAEERSRLRQLQREVSQAKLAAPEHSTKGLFKAACSTDLLFLIDTTSSMASYIEAAKNQVRGIMGDIKAAFLKESDVRISVVGYKDHADTPNVQFLDFTPSIDQVSQFLNQLDAVGGGDTPEDVLGGVRQALHASWSQQTRCIVHIADAPAHSRALHDLHETNDDYYKPGSEPHGLTYEPLFRKLIQLNINYALLRINSLTDRMSLAFSRVYDPTSAEVKLHKLNIYYKPDGTVIGSLRPRSFIKSDTSNKANAQFEEAELGTSYSELRHLVVKTVASSVSRTANRLSMTVDSLISDRSGKMKRPPADLTAIREDGSSGVEGFCPDVVIHSASTLNNMMDADENIKLSVAELTIYARSTPFEQGSVRVASYARTAASTNRFVVKAFKEDDKGLEHVVEDMQAQALCKAFALEFNGLLKPEYPIDFIVTTCLQQSQPGGGSRKEYLSLEPFLEGEYVKYNSNGLWVKDDTLDDPFNRMAQAFSHFTFERSWGHFLVADLQGVNQLLTDPVVHTRDPQRFKLNVTNLHEEGFKFFFTLHKCNDICRRLGLKTTGEMFITDRFEYRERWPTMDPTACCSNKLCRRIVRLANAHKSDQFPGYHWCDLCWPQLQSSIVPRTCVTPGSTHEFFVSKFFYESQGRKTPQECSEHEEKDVTASSVAVVGGSLWNRMNAANMERSISGRSW
ncbi:hypothetical protein E0Z10_g9349 [Xylaria hypoxylon]|uniref:Alpha-type protein kinase domain-containing protein n=1 Tax=Xylaria hypoxylon TaxID=37992 RepID=A0A4Z0YL69_9PEZI|nr:hypothetical protein E0Z10_g9349 [Xylaria hypoxylon]